MDKILFWKSIGDGIGYFSSIHNLLIVEVVKMLGVPIWR